jgi:hypothetical protein
MKGDKTLETISPVKGNDSRTVGRNSPGERPILL